MVLRLTIGLFLVIIGLVKSQSGYEIEVRCKGCKDTVYYLVKYMWDQQYIVDTCKKVKNGIGKFSGKKELEKGVYTLVSQEKAIYFDFFVNETNKFQLSFERDDLMNTLKASNKENQQFIEYARYVSNKNADFMRAKEGTKGLRKEDSIKKMSEISEKLTKEVKDFEDKYMEKVKGTFIYDVLNLKTEKIAKDVPKASNGRPDSIFQYNYYRSHFLDGINFKDPRILRTPFFDDRMKRYFEQVIPQIPDTVIKEFDRVMALCEPNSMTQKMLVAYMTYQSETSKILGYDKVFVHLVDKYLAPKKVTELYNDETLEKIKDRANILRNLLLESIAPDLYMIDTARGREVLKMGFDTAKSSAAVTELYYRNQKRLATMFTNLYSVKAKYTVLVFWDVDCGHCQTEIPQLHNVLKDFKDSVDFKVFAVYTKEDLDKWKKFINEKKLSDFIHVFDPVHLNNLKEKYDVYATPVIYILDRDKRIKAKKLSAEQTRMFLRMLERIEKDKKK
jgi:thiol-disulfide isomerase/thioredoxin